MINSVPEHVSYQVLEWLELGLILRLCTCLDRNKAREQLSRFVDLKKKESVVLKYFTMNTLKNKRVHDDLYSSLACISFDARDFKTRHKCFVDFIFTKMQTIENTTGESRFLLANTRGNMHLILKVDDNNILVLFSPSSKTIYYSFYQLHVTFSPFVFKSDHSNHGYDLSELSMFVEHPHGALVTDGVREEEQYSKIAHFVVFKCFQNHGHIGESQTLQK